MDLNQDLERDKPMLSHQGEKKWSRKTLLVLGLLCVFVLGILISVFLIEYKKSKNNPVVPQGFLPRMDTLTTKPDSSKLSLSLQSKFLKDDPTAKAIAAGTKTDYSVKNFNSLYGYSSQLANLCGSQN